MNLAKTVKEVQSDNLEEIYTLVRDHMDRKDGTELLINGYLSIGGQGHIWYLDENEGDRWNLSKNLTIPSQHMRCDICGEHWNPQNLRTHIYREADGHVHESCAQGAESRRELGSFLVSFLEAGLIAFRVEKHENGYWPDAYKNKYYYTDWYTIRTNKADFEIGWRKRVIHLRILDKPDFNMEELFSDCQVTKDKELIHAWTTRDLTRYLKRIASKLELN
jgi:hypothetical protein